MADNKFRFSNIPGRLAEESDFKNGNFLAVDCGDGTHPLPAELFPLVKIIDRGQATVATINALTFKQDGWKYFVTDSGTLSAGSLVVSAGDSVVWNASQNKWNNANQYGLKSDVDKINKKVTGLETLDSVSRKDFVNFNLLTYDGYVANYSFRVNDVIASDSNYRYYYFVAKRGDVFKVEFTHATDSFGFGFSSVEPQTSTPIAVIEREVSSPSAVTQTKEFVMTADGYFLFYCYATRGSSTVVSKGECYSTLASTNSLSTLREGSFATGCLTNAPFVYGNINDKGQYRIQANTFYRMATHPVHKGERYAVEYTLNSDSLRVFLVTALPNSDWQIAKKILLITSTTGTGRYVFDIEDDGYILVSTYSTSRAFLYSVVGAHQIDRSDIEIPPSVEDYIAGKIETINKTEFDTGVPNSKFIFVTDSHFSDSINKGFSARLIKRIVSETGVSSVVWGGDAVVAKSADAVNDLFKQSEYMLRHYKKAIVNNAKLYAVQGNHDFHITDSNNNTPIYYSQEKTKNILFSMMDKNSFVSNPDDAGSTYYYFDDPHQKVRYLVWQTTRNNSNSVTTGITSEQVTFFKNAVEALEDGWTIIAIGHITCYAWTDSGNLTGINTFLNAINSKSDVTVQGVACNFSGLNSVKVLAYVCGHSHMDLQTYSGDILILNTACDAAYKDTVKSPYFENVMSRGESERNYGFWSDQNLALFDVVSINIGDKIVDATRIGAYFSRKFHIEKVECSVGGTATLTPTLTGSLSWHYYKSNFNMSGGTITDNGDGTFSASYASGLDDAAEMSVSAGVVSGTAAGDFVVLAIDENQNKEFWHVVIS